MSTTYWLYPERTLLIQFQDVTTRGEYYPNKDMATAAVSGILVLQFPQADLELRTHPFIFE